MKKHILSLALLTLGTVAVSQAQVSYTNVNDVYYQDFNKPSGWGSSDSNVVWENGVTIPNWYAAWYSNNSGSYAYSTPSLLRQSRGGYTSSTTTLYLYRWDNDFTNGSLGSLANNSYVNSFGVGGTFYGVQIQNNTGADITSFTFGYTGEQWNINSNSNVQSLTVAFSTDATSLVNSGTWTAIPEATFSTPRTSGFIYVNGHLDENKTRIAAVTISGLSIAVGESLWLRWFDVNDANNDHGLAVDDFYFTVAGTPSAVPEPSTWAAIFGVSALAVAVARRARRNRA